MFPSQSDTVAPKFINVCLEEESNDCRPLSASACIKDACFPSLAGAFCSTFSTGLFCTILTILFQVVSSRLIAPSLTTKLFFVEPNKSFPPVYNSF